MKLNIRNKLLVSFIAVLVLTGIVGTIGILSANAIKSDTDGLYQNDLQEIIVANSLEKNIVSIDAAVSNAIIADAGSNEISQRIQQESDARATIDSDLKVLNQDASGQDKEYLDQIDSRATEWTNVVEGALKLAQSDQDSQAVELLATAEADASMIQENAAKLVDEKEAQADDSYLEAGASYNQARLEILGVLAAAILAGLGIAFFLSRSLSKGVQIVAATARQISQTDLPNLAGAMQAMSEGDLTQSFSLQAEALNYHSSDEIGDLAEAFNAMIAKLQDTQVAYHSMNEDLREVVADIVNVSEKMAEGDLKVEPRGDYKGEFARIKNGLSAAIEGLNDTLQQVDSVVSQVGQATEQVQASSQDLASNAQEQSASVEEVASNLEESDSQVKASAENAGYANQLAGQTSTLANTGLEKMKTMTSAMDSISRSSQEIAKIIKVIDEIAFQTNLLALNAAVEAARAGQHGRGFAVVAQEVRNLAERSAKAARSTAELIEDSNRRVQEGVSISTETATSLGEIVQNVVKVKDLVAEIAAASEEQSKALGQINIAMSQVSQGTQSNSAQSEELASTADELGGLADRLREEVARFQLRKSQEPQDKYQVSGAAVETMRSVIAASRKGETRNGKKNGGNGNGHLAPNSIDRDERGYADF